MSENENRVPKRRFKEFEDAEGWEQRKLSEKVEFFTGKSLSWKDISSDGHKECILYGNLYTDYGMIINEIKYFTKNEVKSPVYSKFGDVLIPGSDTTPTGLARASSIEKAGVLLGGDINVLRPMGNINGSFLSLCINANRTELIKLIKGTTVKHIHNSDIKEIQIFLTNNVNEQQCIVNYFKQLDNLITLHQHKLEKMKALKKAYLTDMFPAEGERTPKLRFAGFTDDWEQRKLSEIATMHARIGWQNLRTSEFLDSGEYLLITGTDFQDGAINYSTCHFVERERYIQDKKIQITNGSILITKDGTLGKVAYVQGLKMPATLNAGVFNVEIRDDNAIDGKYLFQYLKAPYLMDYVSKKATGGTIKHLNQNILVDFPVVLPNKEEQTKIGVFFSSLDNLITLHQRKLGKLQNIKKAYLNEMFI